MSHTHCAKGSLFISCNYDLFVRYGRLKRRHVWPRNSRARVMPTLVLAQACYVAYTVKGERPQPAGGRSYAA